MIVLTLRYNIHSGVEIGLSTLERTTVIGLGKERMLVVSEYIATALGHRIYYGSVEQITEHGKPIELMLVSKDYSYFDSWILRDVSWK